jgi:hypothetical protein
MSAQSLKLAAFLIAGIVFAFAAIPVIGVVAAIAIPGDLMGWFKDQGMLGAGLFVVDFCLHFLYLGLPAAVLLMFMNGLLRPGSMAGAMLWAIGYLFALELLAPWVHGYEAVPLQKRYWYSFASPVAVLFAIWLGHCCAAWWSQRKSEHRGAGAAMA